MWEVVKNTDGIWNNSVKRDQNTVLAIATVKRNQLRTVQTDSNSSKV